MTDTIATESTEIIAGTWTIDGSHSEVGFTVRHLMSKVRGQFERFEGTITTGATLAQTTAEATIDLNSISTRDAQRDGHLRSADFFDVENNGPMTFVSTGFDGKKASGELTIKGVTKPIAFTGAIADAPATDPFGRERLGLRLETTIDRTQYGVSWNAPNQSGGNYLADDVKLIAELALVRQEG